MFYLRPNSDCGQVQVREAEKEMVVLQGTAGGRDESVVVKSTCSDQRSYMQGLCSNIHGINYIATAADESKATISSLVLIMPCWSLLPPFACHFFHL